MLKRREPSRRLLVAGSLAAVVLVGLAVRWAFVDQVSGDYRTFVGPWYDDLAANGGFAAVGTDIANYNPPYLYLLAAVTYLPLPKIVAIKAISVVFDLVLAGFAALIVRRYCARPPAWVGCFAAVFLAPTVMINGAAWGQCDSIYAAFGVGSLYFLLREKPWWAGVFFGMALAFKLQAVFFLPVLIIVVVVNRQRLVALLAAPATFLVMLVPAALAGRDWTGLLSIYPNQVTSGGTGAAGAAGNAPRGGIPSGLPSGGPGRIPSGGPGGIQGGGPPAGGEHPVFGGSTTSLTQNAPTVYQWLPASASSAWKYAGVLAAGLAAGAVGLVALLRRRPLTGPQIVVLATTVVLVVPFLLPEMHERYFYLADVLTIVTAFFVRRYWPVAVLVSACSLLTYAPFLWGSTPVPLSLVAVGELVAVVATVAVFVRFVLRGGGRFRRPAEPPRPVVDAVR